MSPQKRLLFKTKCFVDFIFSCLFFFVWLFVSTTTTTVNTCWTSQSKTSLLPSVVYNINQPIKNSGSVGGVRRCCLRIGWTKETDSGIPLVLPRQLWWRLSQWHVYVFRLSVNFYFSCSFWVCSLFLNEYWNCKCCLYFSRGAVFSLFVGNIIYSF